MTIKINILLILIHANVIKYIIFTQLFFCVCCFTLCSGRGYHRDGIGDSKPPQLNVSICLQHWATYYPHLYHKINTSLCCFQIYLTIQYCVIWGDFSSQTSDIMLLSSYDLLLWTTLEQPKNDMKDYKHCMLLYVFSSFLKHAILYSFLLSC